MEDALDVHDDECLNDLFEDSENLLDCELFVLFFEIVEQVAFFAVLHNDLEQFIILIEVVFINFDEVGMYKFLHDVDFFEGLVDFERIYMDAFECEGFVFGVFDEVDATEAALADDVD